MTVGELASAHVGAVASVTVTTSLVGVDGQTYTRVDEHTGTVVRVQHDGPATLLALSSWSGALDPTHPITIETGA